MTIFVFKGFEFPTSNNQFTNQKIGIPLIKYKNKTFISKNNGIKEIHFKIGYIFIYNLTNYN